MLRRIAVTASLKSLFIRIISALSIATSVPAPMAIPTSALASAGASLIPSPIIATFLPCSFKARIFSSFSPGRTSAITSSIPSFFLTASAVFLLSPVNIIVRICICSNWRIASIEDSFTVSATAIMAMKWHVPSDMFPFPAFPLAVLFSCSTDSFLANNKGVFPSSASRSIVCICSQVSVTPFSSINFLFPAKYRTPSILP